MQKNQLKNHIISWDIPAYDIEKEFLKGKSSTTEVCKLIVTNTILIPIKLAVVEIDHKLQPGTIIDTSLLKIRIAAKKQAIDLFEVKNCSNKILLAEDLIDIFGIKKGDVLPTKKKSEIRKLESLYQTYFYQHESFWVNQIININPLTTIFKRKEKSVYTEEKNKLHDKLFEVPKIILQALQKKFDTEKLSVILLTSFLIYLYRINNYTKFSVFFTNPSIEKNIKEFEYFFSTYIPLLFEPNLFDDFFNILQYVNNQIDAIKRKYTYSNDIGFRYDRIFEKIVTIKQYIIITNNFQDVIIPDNSELVILLSEDGTKFGLKTNIVFDDTNFELFNNIHDHICTLLSDISTDQHNKLTDFSVLSKAEYKKIIEYWNNTEKKYDKTKTIIDLFENQVVCSRQNIAVQCESQRLTYLQLNRISNNLACLLYRHNIRANSIVAICVERSLMMIVGILGVLKAGGAYVPLDIEHPVERLKFILHDTQSPVLLVQANLASKFSDYKGKIIILDDIIKDIQVDIKNLRGKILPHDLAYVIYTSGTTGVPKGVQITHGSLMNHMLWMKDTFSFGPKDIVLQKTIFSFDASIWELFISLISGGKLVFANKDAHRDPALLIDSVIQNKVTTLQLVPSMLREFLKQDKVIDCKSLRQIFSGGELLSLDIKKLFFQKFKIKLYNLYGPTETTIECTFHDCLNTKEDLNVDSIGKPIANTKVYVLDSYMKAVPLGIAGELFVSGDCLAKGYINNPGLTAEKFIINPFFPGTMKKMYKTGDLVRWLSNGCLEYLGRLNDQVKIRGFRVELGEIEAHLLTHNLIQQCAVIIKENMRVGSAQLIAYLVMSHDKEITISDLREFLKNKLPEYMIPNEFVMLDTLPLSTNGKIDKKKLLNSDAKQLVSRNTYVAPANDEEKKLASIWSEVLDISKIGTDDNFFDIGGTSLLALQILTLVKKHWNIGLNLRNFFELPTIAKFSQAIRKYKNKVEPDCAANHCVISTPVVTLQSQGDKTPIFLIHPVGGTIFWFMYLAKYLGTERPIYGVQDPGVELKRPVFSSIEELARFYLSAIRKIQSKGPYIIGGASFGATVAVEISRMLESAGEKVLFIPIFDGWAVYPDKLRDDNYFKNSMQRQHDDLKNKFNAKNITETESLLELQWSRLNLLWHYTMQPIQQKIILFKAKELLPVFAAIDNALNYWDEYAIQPIELNTVPGNHETMFQEPNVKILADIFKKYLNNL